jgi:hypothetical protein
MKGGSGHGSRLLLRDFGCALQVLILASEDYRIKLVMANHGLSEKAAEKMIAPVKKVTGVSKVEEEIGILPPASY